MNYFKVLIFLFTSLAHAVSTVAVLEVVPSGDMSLKLSKYYNLTDELWTIAGNTLSQRNYTILTRDNILSMLPPDSEEAKCLAKSCAVDIGRAIGAEYVMQGFVNEFGGMLILTVELYESISGHLLGSFVTESVNVMGLLKAIRDKAPDLFARINSKATEQKPEPESVISLVEEVDSELDNKLGQKIDTQIESVEKKGNASFWVALGFDLVGVGLVAYGFVKNAEAKDLHYDYWNLPRASSQDEFDRLWEKADDARSMRNKLYIVGSLVLATGIGVHICF
ncbi:MAG: hypothetical protein FWC15_00960 [Fibromonadales bacterium]|nr:hypothetical protein [Fibromonadales bacterium]